MRLLFVCLGNICRSPAAEIVMRARCPDVLCESAGTGGWHIGEAPYGPMQQEARARGYDMSGLRARQFKTADFDAFDMILAMDPANLRDIEELRPLGCATPVNLLTTYAAHLNREAVPDPYYTRDFAGAFEIVEQSCAGLAGALGL